MILVTIVLAVVLLVVTVVLAIASVPVLALLFSIWDRWLRNSRLPEDPEAWLLNCSYNPLRRPLSRVS